MVKNLRIILALFCLLSASTFALNNDSLITALKTMRADTNKVTALYKIALSVSENDSTAGNKYANEMLALARVLKYVKGVAKAWMAMGQIAYSAHSFKQAIHYFEKSSTAYKECNYSFGELECNYWLMRCYRRTADYPLYAKYIAFVETEAKRTNNSLYLERAYEGYGNLYRYLGQYPGSIENYTKAIEIAEKAGMMSEAAIALNNLSLVYGILGQTDEELRIELRTYKIVSDLKDSSDLVLCLSNLSGSYQNLHKTDTSWKCITMAMDIINKKGEKNLNFKDVASVYGQYSTLCSLKKDYHTAVEYQNKNIRISQDYGDIKTVAGGYSALADIFVLMGNKTFAEEYFLKSLAINKEIGFLNGQLLNYESLANFYRVQKKNLQADTCTSRYNILKDSVNAMNSTRKLQEAGILYKINEQKQELIKINEEKKLKEIEQARKLQITYIIGGLLTLLLLGWAILRQRKKRLKQ